MSRRPRRARRRSQNNIFSRDRPKKSLHTGPSSSLPEQQRTTNRPRRQGKTTISVTLYPQSPGCCGRTIYLPVRRVPRQPQVPLDFPASDCYISRSMALFHPELGSSAVPLLPRRMGSRRKSRPPRHLSQSLVLVVSEHAAKGLLCHSPASRLTIVLAGSSCRRRHWALCSHHCLPDIPPAADIVRRSR